MSPWDRAGSPALFASPNQLEAGEKWLPSGLVVRASFDRRVEIPKFSEHGAAYSFLNWPVGLLFSDCKGHGLAPSPVRVLSA